MPNTTARRAEPVLRALCLGLLGLAATPAGAVTLVIYWVCVRSAKEILCGVFIGHRLRERGD